jgi:hypothetical protein
VSKTSVLSGSARLANLSAAGGDIFHILNELTQGHLKRSRQSNHRRQRDIPNAQFHISDIAASEPGSVGQLLLGQPQGSPASADGLAERS